VPRRKQRTDEAVLDEAAVVMAQLGPDFTLADVSRVCGLSPATLVQRFGDKRGLVVRAAGRSNDRFMAALAEAPRAVGVDAVVDLFWTVTPWPNSSTGCATTCATPSSTPWPASGASGSARR
jgi:AcrR family transcriptional regulator